MRSSLPAGLAAALVLAAAGGAPPAAAPPVATVTVAAPSAEPALPPPAPLPPLDPSLPGGSAALASLDTAKLDAILVAVLASLPKERRAIESLVHLADGDIARGGLVRGLALDPGRPMVASLSLTPGGRRVVERVRALVERPPQPDALVHELRAAFEGSPSAGLSARVVVPSTDAAVTLHDATDVLDFAGWKSGSPPRGVDLFYAEPEERAFVGLSRGASEVVLDVVVPSGGPPGAVEALRALRARTAESPRDEPVRLDGALARVRYAPAALADLGLLSGIAATLRAVSSGDVEEADRGKLAQHGLGEAAQSYALAGDARGAFFDRIELWAEGGYGTLAFGARATPGPATQIAEAAWAPGIAPSIRGMFATVDVSVPWLESWAFPGPDPHDPTPLMNAANDVGWVANWIALPQLLAGNVGETMRWFHAHPEVVRRLERVLVFSPTLHGNQAAIGLLAAGAKPADVACALVEPPAPCTPDKRLLPGVPVRIGHEYFGLMQVKGRWAILTSRDKALVQKTRPDLRAAAAPARLDFPSEPLFAQDLAPIPVALFPARYAIEGVLEAGQPTLRIRAP